MAEYFYRSTSSGSSLTSPNNVTNGPSCAGNVPIAMSQSSVVGGSGSGSGMYSMGAHSLYSPPLGPVQGYCSGPDNLGALAGHYSDVRAAGGWYGTATNDPRFASKSRYISHFCFLLEV